MCGLARLLPKQRRSTFTSFAPFLRRAESLALVFAPRLATEATVYDNLWAFRGVIRTPMTPGRAAKEKKSGTVVSLSCFCNMGRTAQIASAGVEPVGISDNAEYALAR